MVGNILGMGQLGSKSPNLSGPQNMNMPNNIGMVGPMGNSMSMSTNNDNVQTMNRMQGKFNFLYIQ